MIPQAVIWDMDGVLIDSGDLYYRLVCEVFSREFGRTVTREQFKAVFGTNNLSVIRSLLGYAPPPELEQRLSDRVDEEFCRYAPEHVRLMPAALETVQMLSAAGWRQAIATSSSHRNTRLVMDLVGLGRWINAVVCTEDVARGKPAPDSFLLAAERLAVKPERCVVVEDAPAGIQAARLAGMPCVGVTTTQTPAALAQADRVVGSLADLALPDFEALVNRQSNVCVNG
jgi:HAD superfamily hydrolase (TIGR01509 family)